MLPISPFASFALNIPLVTLGQLSVANAFEKRVKGHTTITLVCCDIDVQFPDISKPVKPDREDKKGDKSLLVSCVTFIACVGTWNRCSARNLLNLLLHLCWNSL